jgi:aryl-alcohol dehydrogenase-like predicted oxidoreductase
MTFNGGKKSEIGSVGQVMADEITHSAMDLGINFFDTADVYSAGVSESMLGKALGNRRKETVVATKVRFPMDAAPNSTGLSRHHIIESCNSSLKRLNTDYIDLYQIHSYDPGTPLEETLRALDELVKAGKVRYIGCSNLAAWQTMKALSVSATLGLEKFITSQLYYSVGARDIEHELVPLCLDQKLGVLCWSPLSGGFFTGKFRKGAAAPEGSRRSFRDAPSLKYWAVDEVRGYAILEVLETLSRKYGKSISQVSLNWLLQKNVVSSIIAGVKNKEQLLENCGASGWQLDTADIEALDEVGAPPVLYPQSHQLTSDQR